MSDLGSSIILTMAPIFVLMIGILVYGFMKNRGKDRSTQSKHETDALIEAQAMLAKYQKEQAEKTEKSENKSADKNSQEKPEPKNEQKFQKPSADAPISDTAELEPDIDKTEDK